MCLSTFLLLNRPGEPHRILAGRVAESSRWLEAGALDADRIRRFKNGWMLPSSHLLMFESPEDSAHRIAREQLGTELSAISAPLVVSDPYWRGDSNSGDPHWDIDLIFRSEWSQSVPRPGELWRELAFVDVNAVPPVEFARGHRDIIDMARRRR